MELFNSFLTRAGESLLSTKPLLRLHHKEKAQWGRGEDMAHLR